MILNEAHGTIIHEQREHPITTVVSVSADECGHFTVSTVIMEHHNSYAEALHIASRIAEFYKRTQNADFHELTNDELLEVNSDAS